MYVYVHIYIYICIYIYIHTAGRSPVARNVVWVVELNSVHNIMIINRITNQHMVVNSHSHIGST